MLLNEIKKLWMSFFERNGYTKLEELSMVPVDDDSVLWVNSGVSALKKYFANPGLSPSKNMVNSQRVIRTNDIERIDKNSYHQTLFEMLGCFSIGGNFKSDVIPLVWSFLTEKDYLNIDPSRLLVTVLEDDHETFSVWKKQPGLSRERIFFCDIKSNFWDMGEGPCGPNTEIYYCFSLEKLNSGNRPIDFDDKNFVEIANLVFSDRYHRNKDYFPLEKKCVDVGVGLERLAFVVQNLSNTFQTDIWKLPLSFLRERQRLIMGNSQDESEQKFNTIVDHLRTFIIAVSDGVLPQSKHRGYIVKKLIKKAFWISFFLGFSVEELVSLSSVIIDSNSHISGVVGKKHYIVETVKFELVKLFEVFLSYKNEINSYLDKRVLKKEVPADTVFFWYDTKGVPVDLISSFLKDRGYWFDKEDFEELLDKQREMGTSNRKSRKISVF